MSKGPALTGGGPRIDWRELGLWSAAGLLVASLHAGGAWYLQHYESDLPAGDIAPAIMIDMEPLPAPVAANPVMEEVQPIEPEPNIEQPTVEELAALPEPLPEVQPEQKMQSEPEPLPDTIEEATPEPEVPEPAEELQEEVVELPKVEVPLPMVRPEPEKPGPRKTPAEKVGRRPESKPAAAPVTAENSREGVQQPRVSASSAASARQAQKWSARVQAYLVRRTRSARTSGEGTVRVSFVVTRDGAIISASIVGSSGVPQLDQSVLDAVRRASPVPAAPDDVTVARQSFTVPFLIR